MKIYIAMEKPIKITGRYLQLLRIYKDFRKQLLVRFRGKIRGTPGPRLNSEL